VFIDRSYARHDTVREIDFAVMRIRNWEDVLLGQIRQHESCWKRIWLTIVHSRLLTPTCRRLAAVSKQHGLLDDDDAPPETANTPLPEL
jgi:hypothetical protein